jgi:uncharacterized membrane protein YbhN (UPF0104 family)
MRSSLRNAAIAVAAVAISVLALAVAFLHIDADKALNAVTDVDARTVIVASTMIVAAALLASVRLWFIASDMGHRLTAREAMLALSLGQIAGAATVQFFGQIAARTALLSTQGIGPSVVVAISIYERIIAVSVSGMMAIAGGWFLFGRFTFDLSGGGLDFLLLLLGLAGALIGGAILGWGRSAWRDATSAFGRTPILSASRSLALTAYIQGGTALAYVVLARHYAPDIPLAELFAASTIVMFAASLPISFSGWGIRELSAVLALTTVGMPAPSALAVALIVGGVSMLAVVAIAAVAAVLPGTSSRAVRIETRRITVDRLIVWALPIAAATLVFFQVFIPTRGGQQINVNLADLPVLLGGPLFALLYLRRQSWRVPRFVLLLGAATIVIVAGVAHGVFRLGATDWALTNKLGGWFVLLAYLGTGALIAASAGRFGVATMMRTFVGAACGVVIVTVLVTQWTHGPLWHGLTGAFQIAGFSANRNAFALVLFIALCLIGFLQSRHRPWVFAVLVVGLAFSGSKACAIAALAAGALWILLKPRPLASTVTILAIGVIGVGLILAASWMAEARFLVLDRNTTNERLGSLSGGWNLFVAHPVFGAGIGAYMLDRTATGYPIVIHSTPLWLLAETGLAGFAVFAFAGWTIVRSLSPRRDMIHRTIVLILVGVSVASLAHELLYQRAIWLILGALLALPAKRTGRETEQVLAETTASNQRAPKGR